MVFEMDMAVVCCGSLWSMVILLSVITVGATRLLLLLVLADTNNQNKQSEISSSQIQRDRKRDWRDRETCRNTKCIRGGGA